MINFLNKIERPSKRKRAAFLLGCISIVALALHFTPYIIAEAKFYLKNDSYDKNIGFLPIIEEKIIEIGIEEDLENDSENNDAILEADQNTIVQNEKENYVQTTSEKSFTIATSQNSQKSGQQTYIPSVSYTLLIPKINVESKIKLNVDMFDKKAYEEALVGGVAHASGTTLPGGTGNSFIFGHSSAPLGITRNYATIEFILLNHLEIGDEVFILKGSDKYSYKVFDKKVVSDDSVEYIHKYYGKNTVTLMTCWPPGTNLKRLLVIAEEIEK